MLSSRSAIVIAVVMLAIFSGVTIETIGHGSSSLSSSSLSASSGSVRIYSPQNGSAFLVNSSAETINVSLSIISQDSPVYIYDISPSNLSGFAGVTSLRVYSLPNLTYFNRTLYPYNYMEQNVTTGANSTISLTLFINSTDFSDMNVSIPQEGKYYPYLVEILAETSSGAAGIGFTILRIPST